MANDSDCLDYVPYPPPIPPLGTHLVITQAMTLEQMRLAGKLAASAFFTVDPKLERVTFERKETT